MSCKQKESQTKPVIMLSTFVGAYDVAHHKDDSKSVPAIVGSYNKLMGEIDKSDQILCAYLDERKLLQLTKKIIFNLLMRLVMNSYILNKLNTQKALNWQDYLIEIVESLASELKKYYIWKTKQSTNKFCNQNITREKRERLLCLL